MTPLERIDAFNAELLLPLYVEILNSPRLAQSGRAVHILSGRQTGDPVADAALARVHPARRQLADLEATPAATQPGEWVGHTLLICEPAAVLASYADPQAGRFYSSVIFTITDDHRVLAAPRVFYWMECNERMHAFAQRYDHAIAEHEISAIDRTHLLHHALSSIGAYDIGAFSPFFPWQEPGMEDVAGQAWRDSRRWA